jgi:hypothetical protein
MLLPVGLTSPPVDLLTLQVEIRLLVVVMKHQGEHPEE